MDYKALIDYLNNNDHFVKDIGVTIEDISEGFARVKLVPNDTHTNANGFINGGALYTLADFAGVCAASSYGYRITTVTGHINYLKAVKKEDVIYGIARVSKAGKSIIDIDVQIIDNHDKLYMQSSLTFYNLGVELEL